MRKLIVLLLLVLGLPLYSGAQIPVPLNQPYYCYVLLHKSAGGLINADATPTYEVLENGTDAAIITGSLTARVGTSTVGEYYVNFSATPGNGFELGKIYDTRIRAIVEGVDDKEDCPSFRVTAPEASTGYSAVDATLILGAAINTSTAQVGVNVVTVNNQTASASGPITFPNATLASTTNITGGTITTVTNLTNAPTNGDLTATMKTSVTTAATAATPTAAAVTGNVGGSVLGNVNGNVNGTAGGFTAAGWAGAFTVDTTKTYGDAVANSVVKVIADSAGGSMLTDGSIALAVWNLTTTEANGSGPTFAHVVLNLAAAGDPLNSTVPGAYPAGTAGYLLGNNLNGQVTSRASQTSLDTLAGRIVNSVTGLVDVNVIDWKSAVAPAMTGDAFARIGANGAGLTALATQASVNTVSGFVDTEVAAILAKVNPLPADPADESLLLAAINTRSAYDFKRSVGFTWGMAFTDTQGNPVITGTPACTRAIDQVTTFAAGGVSATAVNSFGYSLLTVGTTDMDGNNFTFVRCTLTGSRGFQYIFRIEQP